MMEAFGTGKQKCHCSIWIPMRKFSFDIYYLNCKYFCILQTLYFDHLFSYLGVSGRQFGRPISGQAEVIGENSISSTSQWISMEGLFIHKNEYDSRSSGHDPSEF